MDNMPLTTPEELKREPLVMVTKDQQTASEELAHAVLAMQLITTPGRYARALARKVLGLDDFGQYQNSVALNTNGTVRVIPADEPLFLIRGQDQVSGDVVRVWANFARMHGASQDILDAATAQAALMDQWPKKKVPDLRKPE